MPKLKVYKFPDTVLTQKALPIAHVDSSFFQLADDMLETMYHAPGVGLAANQVGILKRIVVIDVDYTLEDSAEGSEDAEVLEKSILKNKNPQIILNPEIIYKEGSILFKEGCLSVPGFSCEVKRAEKLKLKYQNIDGLEKILSAEGLLAIAIQHEIDHLDGKLFIDRLSPLKKEMIKRKLKKERLERDQDEKDGILLKPTNKEKGF
ncbi:MAG: peptide deformylase [Deltaproteobacteria bacterium]|nr:peptide deformylase [Deltaproteobacteria bacterium]